MDINSSDIKQKMMKLWKDTFHDSDAYISLVFENYYNPEFIEYHEEKGQVISALLGIPYEFSNGTEKISGMYLCGLATKEDFRHKGIMSELIKKISDKARDKGFVISFLIPASDMLRIYYQSKGYVNAIYRVEERYTEVHDFYKDCLYAINKDDEKVQDYRFKYLEELSVSRLEENDEKSLEKIKDYIQKKEQESKNYLYICHTKKDIDAIVKDNRISSGEIYYIVSKNDEMKGVAFITFDERKRIIIPKIFFDDSCAYFKILDTIKKVHSESPMSIWRYPEEIDRYALWDKVYGAPNPNGLASGSYGVAERVFDVSMHSQPYGMIKILNILEILKFIAKDRSVQKFSILVKEDNFSKEGILYKVEANNITSKNVDDTQIKHYNSSKDVTVLSYRDLLEILLRKKDSSSLIMEAFGLPRISFNMALMLD